jgi:transcriptional regulator with XRE-family HTH domain
MAEDVPGPTDLLGDPLRALPDRRGRRKLKFTTEVYDKVEVLRASGMTQEEIAKAIGITVPTLRKYFFQELQDGEVRTRADIIAAMAEKALKGSVPAARLVLGLLDQGKAAVPIGTPKAPRPEKLGKKEQLNLDAQTGEEGTGWEGLLN